jgi:2-haloacid dehalogenase
MATTLAFDVYGTLIDTHGVVQALKDHLGDQARAFSSAWRNKQLEYTFRRGLMQRYQSFEVCTREALAYACLAFNLALGQEDMEALLAVYQTLPAFPDAKACLAQAQEAGFRLFAFSNGTAMAVDRLLRHAELRNFFLDVVSVEEVPSFKPDPRVYEHFLRRAAVPDSKAWLISSNPFDVLGALSAGMRSAWVRRSPEIIFDPWGVEPTLTVADLTTLSEGIARFPSAV